MKESIRDLMRQTASAEETYEDVAANFNNILASVSDELKEYVELQGEEQCQTYIAKCLERVRGVHGSLDGTQFIPMIISNVTTHHALVLNQRVNQSQIPLQIMISPMRTQAATMGASLKFIEFLSKRVLVLDVKLGLTSSVSIESGGEGLVSSPPLERVVRQPPWSLRLLPLPRSMTPLRHHPPDTCHPWLITLMVPLRPPKLQAHLQNLGRCSVPKLLLCSPSSWA